MLIPWQKAVLRVSTAAGRMVAATALQAGSDVIMPVSL